VQLDPRTIREASFTLAPSGYNPEQVDDLLASLADEILETGSVEATRVTPAGLTTVPAGYSQHEVDAFLSQLAQHRSTDPAQAEATSDANSAASTHTSDGDDDRAEEHTVTGQATSQPVIAGESMPLVAIDELIAPGTLPHAVQRTKQVVVELEEFLEQQLELAKAACNEAITHTNTDCSNTLQTAESIAQSALTMVEGVADDIQTETSRAVIHLRHQFEEQLSTTRSTFETQLGECETTIESQLQRLLENATTKTHQLQAEIRDIHAYVQDSLNDARSVLTNTHQKAA
jgi:DivIVA domain-containing protein